MALNPPPTIETNLALITQSLLRSDMSRAAQLTFAFHTSGTPGVPLALFVVNAFQTAFNARIAPAIDSNVTIEQPFVRLGDGSATPYEELATGASIVGGNAGTYAPPNVACLCKKVTGSGGKKNRGRTYIPFILPVTAVSENGTVDPGTATALNTRLANFMSDMVASTSPMVIANKTYNQPLPPHYVTAITYGPTVSSWSVEPLIATQRRRLGR
jgi:hypothetical protein